MRSTRQRAASVACLLLLSFSTFSFTVAQDAASVDDVVQGVVEGAVDGAVTAADMATADQIEPLAAGPAASPEEQQKLASQTGGEIISKTEAELMERLPGVTLEEEGLLANSRLLRVVFYSSVAAMAFLVPVLLVKLVGRFFFDKVTKNKETELKPVSTLGNKATAFEEKLDKARAENELLKGLLPV
mmetsp:Transcript_33326/g.55915  ORF Transcript_33326/g.55915 Transcript_33326/m.55915 type:complete len:187 (+) Transcript_33326:240-800(+)|eukprot:CAMPEP_0198212648 /NCGR_PEP_ID=MMETSP1445-20131203/26995_1 /TAXON_ID=36898 /ORGANISM="Pyramimonas sp., Strain CCMP2087" /LENGTH=186 /DNA_ID=CAMNT_0043887145 /DNA_START=238 /DNA_END=798 /DNA_ORIENTATION=+